YKGKNGADIRIAIDVMDVALRQADITHVALVSGDSDFTPLVTKLRESGRVVLGVGVKSNTSNYLAKSCDVFSFYDDLRPREGAGLPERSIPSTPTDPVALIATALAALGNKPVPGSALKTQMRKMDPMFDEVALGHNSFLEFLRSHEEIIDLYKPAVGDVTIAPKGQLGANSSARNGATSSGNEGAGGQRAYNHPAYTPYTSPSSFYGAPSAPFAPTANTATERLRIWLRDNNFRYVPSAERQQIIHVVYDTFTSAREEEISLKEAKDRLHQWFEENRPSVPWESINSTVYHLFYTWCFFFDRTDGNDNKQLWDRRTSLHSDIHSAEELMQRCDRGIIRKLWERDRSDIDGDALNDWLYDGDAERRKQIGELIVSVTTAAPGPVAVGAPPGRQYTA
ncbi:MAG: NYN domain-containing protein, partial [Cytophagales bacterium]|nr:NYN domain-containing protein [Armatimonadota bacterium]